MWLGHSPECPVIPHGIYSCWSITTPLTKYGLWALETSSFTLKFGLDGPHFITELARLLQHENVVVTSFWRKQSAVPIFALAGPGDLIGDGIVKY